MMYRADPASHAMLTTISFRAKGYWGYPEEYFRLWEKELTMSPEYIESNLVLIYRDQSAVAGYYSLVMLEEERRLAGFTLRAGWWLDHMFIVPERMGEGIGRKMFGHCWGELAKTGADRLHILADPHAVGFYLKMGCRLCGQAPSTIPGRTTPYLVCGAVTGCDRVALRR